MATPSRPTSNTETRVGLAILLALVAIAVALGLQQFRYDPQRFRLGIPPAAPGAGTVPALPPGAVALAPPERFDAGTLSDKIDGRADLYLAAGFRSLECRRFAARAGEPDVVEACVYDLGTPGNAYSAWSQQRREGAPDAAIGPHSYATSSGYFLCAGRLYVEVRTTRGGEGAMALARAFATTVAAAQGPGSGASGEAALLPAANRLAGSEALLKEGAFGFDRMDHVSLARYRMGDREATGFVTARADPAAAAALSAAWRDTLLAQGCSPLEPPAGIPGAWALDAAGWVEIGFARGNVVGGVHEAESRGAADALAASLWKAIEGGTP